MGCDNDMGPSADKGLLYSLVHLLKKYYCSQSFWKFVIFLMNNQWYSCGTPVWQPYLEVLLQPYLLLNKVITLIFTICQGFACASTEMDYTQKSIWLPMLCLLLLIDHQWYYCQYYWKLAKFICLTKNICVQVSHRQPHHFDNNNYISHDWVYILMS